MNNLKDFDNEIYNLATQELNRQNEYLEMIASENFTIPAVMETLGSVFTNKYAEGYPNKRYYSGCEYVDKVEELAISRVCELFSCKYANVQPHSGSQANAAVYMALLSHGDTILGMDLSHGGHLTHGSKVNFSGKNYQSFFYGLDENGYIDYDRVLEISKVIKPKMIVCGASAYAREIDFKRFREIADIVGAYFLADVAHIAGLIVAGEHMNPFPYAHVVTTTTHKTLAGPRGGVILSNDEELMSKINSAIFPGTQGGPLMNTIAAKAVGFKYNLSKEWKEYAKQVKANAKIIADVLIKRGYELISNGTDNHLVLVSLLNKDFSGKDAQFALHDAGISINKNSVPNEKRSPFITSGIRIGSPALTTRGMKEKEFEFIANKICDVLDDIENKEKHLQIKKDLEFLSKQFPIYI